MTIAHLLHAREAVSVLYQAKVDGKTALAIRKAARLMQAPLRDYDDVLKVWVEKEGVDGKQISELSADQREYWQELVTSNVDATWEAPLTLDALDEVKLSAAQIDALIAAGLVRDDVEPAQVPA